MPDPKREGSPRRTALQQHLATWAEGCGSESCSRARRVVHVRGSIPCEVAFVGEAPGESEDVLGVPFVGPAGKLLDQIAQNSGVLSRKCAWMNLVGCIPRELQGGKATEPDMESIEACAPRLQELLDLATPRLVVCVGAMPRDWLRRGYRNPVHIPPHVKIIDIVHPAAILRANITSRGLMAQKAAVSIAQALEELDS